MDLAKFTDFYNNNITKYDNSIYQDIGSRFVHLINFCNNQSPFNRWFNKRLGYYIEECGNYNTVIDLGFSIPYPYIAIDNKKLGELETKFIFVDKEKSAIDFYEMLTSLPLLSERKERDRVIINDLELKSSYRKILDELSLEKNETILVVCSEIIEHLSDASHLWEFIGYISKLSKVQTVDVFVTLPVGVKIPSHKIWFSNESEAKNYLEKNLKITNYKFMIPPEELPPIDYAKGVCCAVGNHLSHW